MLSFAAYSGVRPNGDYWVFLEVNEAAMGGRPNSDGPDTVEELMRNTRNNPLEDLGMHLPLICDRYEVARRRHAWGGQIPRRRRAS